CACNCQQQLTTSRHTGQPPLMRLSAKRLNGRKYEATVNLSVLTLVPMPLTPFLMNLCKTLHNTPSTWIFPSTCMFTKRQEKSATPWRKMVNALFVAFMIWVCSAHDCYVCMPQH